MKKAFVFLSALVFLSCLYSGVSADSVPVIVSLGDSYSCGEGIEPFYGQDAEMALRCLDPDWLAHRSEKSWPMRIVCVIPEASSMSRAKRR